MVDNKASGEGVKVPAPAMDNSEHRRADAVSTTIGTVLTIGVVLLVAVNVVMNRQEAAEPMLDLIVDAGTTLVGEAEDVRWRFRGRVLQDGDPQAGAEIWVVVRDEYGNAYSPPKVQSDDGTFSITDVPFQLGGVDVPTQVVEAVVHAKVTQPQQEGPPLYAAEILNLSRTGLARPIKVATTGAWLVFGLFMVSIFIALTVPNRTSLIAWKYYLAIVLAFVFTGAMVVFIARGLATVNAIAVPGEVRSLGFASLFHGTYVERVGEEWLLSLTAPPEASLSNPGQGAVQGLGAPLWIILLAVVGAGLFTVRLVVKDMLTRPNWADAADVRKRVQKVVMHQFFILFAPLGAVLVYQLLVAAGAANEVITVALAILGAGAAADSILAKALERAQGTVG
jgi:hypothetical protein